MALDAATLALVANELNSTLLDAKIDKIFEPTRDEVLMTLRTRTQTFKLLLSARSGSARVCLTKESFENAVMVHAAISGCPDCRIRCRPNPISRIFWQPAPPPWWPLPAKKTCRWLLLWAKRLAVSAPLLRGRLCGVPLAAKRPCWPVTWTKRRSRPCAPQSKT